MNGMKLGVLAAALACAIPGIVAAQSARVDLATTLRQLDAGFVCPQFLPNDTARRAEIAGFARTLAAKGVSFAQATGIRAHFLARHNCNGSMASAAAAGEPAADAAAPVTVAATGGHR